MVNRCWQNIATKGGIGMVNYRQLYLIVRACTLNNIGSITNAPKWADNYHAAMKFSLIRKIRGLSRFFRARSYSSRLSIYFVNESVINRNYILCNSPSQTTNSRTSTEGRCSRIGETSDCSPWKFFETMNPRGLIFRSKTDNDIFQLYSTPPLFW